MTASSTPAPQPASDVLVSAENLVRHYGIGRDAVVRAVDGVSLHVRRSQTLGLVGESGSGKSTVARLLLHLEKPTSGRVLMGGRDLVAMSGRELRQQRRHMQIVFQDPFAALNRRKVVEQIIGLPLSVHYGLTGAARAARVRELLDLVGLRRELADRYPHQMSGGQCQRVGIARALAVQPEFVVLDEAVSAVDVSVRAQLLNLLKDLQARLGLTYLFVSHDLAVVRYMARSVAVMYHGRIVESGSRESLFDNPLHPYTHSLLKAIPVPQPEQERANARARIARADDADTVPDTGCRFRARCPLGRMSSRCADDDPQLTAVAPDHSVACHFPQSPDSILHHVRAEVTTNGSEPS